MRHESPKINRLEIKSDSDPSNIYVIIKYVLRDAKLDWKDIKNNGRQNSNPRNVYLARLQIIFLFLKYTSLKNSVIEQKLNLPKGYVSNLLWRQPAMFKLAERIDERFKDSMKIQGPVDDWDKRLRIF